MPRSDFTVFTVANDPSDAKILGSIHASVSGTHRLRITAAAVPASGQVRFQRTGVSKTNAGVAIFSTTDGFPPLLLLFLRITTLADPGTYYFMRVSTSGGTVSIFRVVAGVATNLVTVSASLLDQVNEFRFMVVGSTLQAERRNVTAGDVAFTVLATVVDPSPIEGPGGVGFGALADNANTNPSARMDLDNWREFDAS